MHNTVVPGFLRKIFVTTLFCIAILFSTAKAQPSDSLLYIVKNDKNPENRINALLKLSDQEGSDHEKALTYVNQALELAKQEGNERDELNALIRLSQIYYSQSNYKESIETALKGKALAQKLDLKPQMAILLDGIGLIYYNLGDKKECAANYFSSLKIAEQLGNKELICKTLSRIGLLYNDQKEYDKALEYFLKSQKISKELNDNVGLAVNLNNLGNVYYQKGDYKKSLYYLKEALKISKMIGNEWLEATNYVNFGKAYLKLKNYLLAMQYLNQALEIFDRIKDLTKASSCRLNIAEAYIATGKYQLADEKINEVLSISKQQGLKDFIYQSYKLFHELSLHQHDTSEAYKYTILENQWKDSLALGENKRNLARMELQYHFEKQEQLDKAEQAKRSILNTAIIITLALSIIIILLILNQLRLKAKKSKLEKEGLEKELDFKKKELTLNVMSLMKKTEMLTDLYNKIVQFEKEATHDETRQALKRVSKELQKTSEDDTLKEFSLRFKEVHKDFYDTLLRQFPDLSPSDLKLCAFLRLNMTTKEISELTGQRLNTLENARYRLRLKLGITNSEVNLVTFLAQI